MRLSSWIACWFSVTVLHVGDHRSSLGTSYCSLLIDRTTVTFLKSDSGGGAIGGGAACGSDGGTLAGEKVALLHSRLGRDRHFRSLPQNQRQLADIDGEKNLQRLLLGHLEGHQFGDLRGVLMLI